MQARLKAQHLQDAMGIIIVCVYLVITTRLRSIAVDARASCF
jgi:hypothetical protein